MADSNTPASGPAPVPAGNDPISHAVAAAVPGVETNAAPLFAGPVSLWMGAKTFFVGILADLGAVALLVYWAAYAHGTPVGTGAMIAGFALLFASSAMMLYSALSVRSCRYTITHRHIERELGLFVKTVDALPLGNVKRVDFKQSFIGRIINVGTIEVYCGQDDVRPHWLLEGIPNPRPTYEKLRDAVMDLTMRRGIILE